MIPNILFLAFYIIYTTLIFEHNEWMKREAIEDPSMLWCLTNRSCQIGIILVVTYFIVIEIIQAWKDHTVYLTGLWNYLDVFSILLIILTSTLDFFGIQATIQRPLFAITTLIMWFKTLYYLRIFRNVGYLTSMIL
jgi:hypothetical protein